MGETARTPGPVAWPEQMITRAEAFGLAAEWPVFVRSWFDHADGPERGVNLYCGKDRCEQSMGQLRRDGVPYNGSLDEMLSMVLRHMVMAHDVPLAGLRAGPGCACCGSTPARPGEITCQRCAGYEDRALDHRHQEATDGR